MKRKTQPRTCVSLCIPVCKFIFIYFYEIENFIKLKQILGFHTSCLFLFKTTFIKERNTNTTLSILYVLFYSLIYLFIFFFFCFLKNQQQRKNFMLALQLDPKIYTFCQYFSQVFLRFCFSVCFSAKGKQEKGIFFLEIFLHFPHMNTRKIPISNCYTNMCFS